MSSFLRSIRVLQVRPFVLPARSFTAKTMSFAAAPLVLSPNQVHALTRSNDPSVRLLDATWFMPNSPRNPKEEFASRRLPGAQYLDLDAVASPHELGLKHMMPSERVFADACESFGIEPSSHVILYDTHGVFSSPRALFMFRSFGHGNSSILDGGLPLWQLEGFPIEEGSPSHIAKSTYPVPSFDTHRIRNYEQILSNSALDPTTDPTAELVLDARSKGRFLGMDPEPRPGLSSGHIPHSLSLPFNVLLKKNTTDNGVEYTTLLSPHELRIALEDVIGAKSADMIIKGQIPVVTSCGSGMTAGILWLGLKLLGVENVSIYDESWTGYAMRSTSKIDKAL